MAFNDNLDLTLWRSISHTPPVLIVVLCLFVQGFRKYRWEPRWEVPSVVNQRVLDEPVPSSPGRLSPPPEPTDADADKRSRNLLSANPKIRDWRTMRHNPKAFRGRQVAHAALCGLVVCCAFELRCFVC